MNGNTEVNLDKLKQWESAVVYQWICFANLYKYFINYFLFVLYFINYLLFILNFIDYFLFIFDSINYFLFFKRFYIL